MPGPEVPDFHALDPVGHLDTVVYDAPALPEETWQTIYSQHRDALNATLLVHGTDQGANLLGDLGRYRETRVDPNLLRGQGFRQDQLFGSAQVTIASDKTKKPICVVTTSNNTSATHLPDPLKPIEYWAKMLTPPDLALPLVGGKRYVHLRDIHTRPFWEPGNPESPLIDPDIATPLMLAGLYYALSSRHPKQNLAVYIDPLNPVDHDLGELAEILDMYVTGTDELIRYVMPIRDVRQTIESMPGALQWLELNPCRRITTANLPPSYPPSTPIIGEEYRYQ